MAPAAVFALPFFQLYSAVGLFDTHIAVALAHCLFNVPLAVWILEGFMSGVPREIDETAYIDGYSFPRFFLTIFLPLIKAGVGVAAFFCFMFSWVELLLARTLTSLDHFTEGRIAWNVVTGYQDSAARNLGLDRQPGHDERYDRADAYLDAMYRQFEGSVERDAVVADRESGVFADPAKVHPIGVEGPHVRLPGVALAHPGPQGTPFLFQAGASSRGRRFALEHAEAVFYIGPTTAHVRRFVEQTREGLREAGRPEDAIRVLAMVTVVVADTDEEAQARLAEYHEHVDVESALALFGGWTGVDLSGLDPDAELEHVESEASRTALAAFTTQSPDRRWTVREVAEFVSVGGRGPVIVGSPATVADELERWHRETGVDGFNISAAVRPTDLERFARLVSPELRRRGLLREPEAGRTLRENVAGAALPLPADALAELDAIGR